MCLGVNLQKTHLFKGRHGIWYVRIVVPPPVRHQHPELPAELKRSTRTAVRRLAEAFSRKMCLEFATKYLPSGSLVMSTFFDRHLVQPMMLTRDANTGRVTHIQTDPHDSAEVRKLLEEIRANEWR